MIGEKPLAFAATAAAVVAVFGVLAVWPASSEGQGKGARAAKTGAAMQADSSNSPGSSEASPPSSKTKKNVLRLIPDPEPESPKRAGIVRRQSTPMLGAVRPGKTNGDKDKWLAYRHENDSHPPMESSWISYAHEGDDYQGDKHDTNRSPTLGDSWVLPSPAPTLPTTKSNPKLRQAQSAKNLRPPPAAFKEPAPPVPTALKVV